MVNAGIKTVQMYRSGDFSKVSGVFCSKSDRQRTAGGFPESRTFKFGGSLGIHITSMSVMTSRLNIYIYVYIRYIIYTLFSSKCGHVGLCLTRL